MVWYGCKAPFVCRQAGAFKQVSLSGELYELRYFWHENQTVLLVFLSKGVCYAFGDEDLYWLRGYSFSG